MEIKYKDIAQEEDKTNIKSNSPPNSNKRKVEHQGDKERGLLMVNDLTKANVLETIYKTKKIWSTTGW